MHIGAPIPWVISYSFGRRRAQAPDADAERGREDDRDHRKSEREGRSDIHHLGNYWPNFGLTPLVFLYAPSADTLWPKPHAKLPVVCEVTTSVPGLENLSVILHDSLLTGIKTAVSPLIMASPLASPKLAVHWPRILYG